MGNTQPLRTWQCSILNLWPPANGGRVRFQLPSFEARIEGPRDPWRRHEVKINSLLIYSRRRIIDSSSKAGSVKSDRPEGERSGAHSRTTDGWCPRAGGSLRRHEAREFHC